PSTAVAITQPAVGATITGAVALRGTALAGTQVSVSARLIAAGAPGFSITTKFGQKISVPAQRAGTTVTAKATATTSGEFSASVNLAPGTWDLTVNPGTITRLVSVRSAAGLHGTLTVAASPSYISLLQDGVALQGVSGRVISRKNASLSAKQTIVVLAG